MPANRTSQVLRRSFYLALLIDIFKICIAQQELGFSLPTVTVRGFLNFKTTVDGTVLVFTPASAADSKTTSSSALPETFFTKESFSSKEEMHQTQNVLSQNSLETAKTLTGLNIFDNNMKDPYFHHISDNAVLPSSGQVNNDIDQVQKLQPSVNQYPTGLVTVLGGTYVDGFSTTVHETKVIGTYIDGKYAQILQSTSHIVSSQLSSTPTTPILYAPTDRINVEHSKSISYDVITSPVTILHISETSKSKFSIFPSSTKNTQIEATQTISSQATTNTQRDQFLNKLQSREKVVIPLSGNHDNSISLKPNEMKSSLHSSFAPIESTVYSHMDGKFIPTATLESVKKSSRFRQISTLSPTVIRLSDDDNTVAVIKNQRNNTLRTRFLSPRRPSQTVRLNRFKVKLTLRHDASDEYNVTLPVDDDEMEDDPANKGDDDFEMVTEATGIPLDPARVVFQETTITSEITLHVGRRKSVRTLTITTSVPLTVNPTDIQHILSSQPTTIDETNVDQHIVSRTFTTTERTVKTSVVPIFDGKSTLYHSVTESFFIMKIVTAYKTLPVGDPSLIESFLDSELSATTLATAANLQASVTHSLPIDQIPNEDIIHPSIDLPTAQPPLTNPLLSLGHALSNNPLAAVYLGLQQLNAQMTLYSTITGVSTYTTTEVIYSTKTIKFYDGKSTRNRMISDPITTKKATITTTVTSVQPYINTHALQQQQQLQKLIAATQLTPVQPQYSTITSTFTTVTTATNLSTRIYTLIYNGFSTKFRTVTSTRLYPTTIVTTTTTKLPIAPTQLNLAFPYPHNS